ncbi:cold shock-like protein CspD [Yersinia enterocolitica]|uniref:cold shock-like protein CspD n=1 Tax=Yersinia enterocolitica TaxID=630 RepID=UPI001C8E5616|nr:cold shock-like protein CspD [Yersinia enterocolitica]MBX9487952.1 cold shock-like protein CspD [Yersinia enterocolitica]MBX9491670.1 cold shock-like protein CspD [Yersinia enterocolitica]
METGTVKWFNNAKGFGFICPEGGGEDIFAHYSTIQMDGYRTLKAGQMVNFDVHQGPKGSHASLIVPLEFDVVLQEAIPQEHAALA